MKWGYSVLWIPYKSRIWGVVFLLVVYLGGGGLPGGTSAKELNCQCRRPEKHGFRPWVGKRRAQQHTPVYLPGESHGQRSLVSYSPWFHKESDMTGVTACMLTWNRISPAKMGLFEISRELQFRVSHHGKQGEENAFTEGKGNWEGVSR